MKRGARSKNFTSYEEESLVSLANKYKSILENKKSDSQTVRKKTEIWSRIANEFNATCPLRVSYYRITYIYL